jgi:hypothetical protein
MPTWMPVVLVTSPAPPAPPAAGSKGSSLGLITIGLFSHPIISAQNKALESHDTSEPFTRGSFKPDLNPSAKSPVLAAAQSIRVHVPRVDSPRTQVSVPGWTANEPSILIGRSR